MSIFSTIFGAATGGLGSVALDTVGGLAAGYLPKIFGLDSGANASQGLSQGIRDVTASAPSLTQASMYNAAGYTGSDVQNTFGRQLDSLQNSVQARQAATAMRNLGSQALSNVGTQYSNARSQANQAMGDVRRNLMGALSAGGASPAAMAASIGRFGDAGRQTASALYGEAGNQYMNALGLAGNMQGQAQNILGQDLALRNQIYVDPYRAQLNQGVAGLAGDIAQAQSQIGMQKDHLVTQPWAGLASGLGDLGSRYRVQYFNENNQQPGGMGQIPPSAQQRAQWKQSNNNYNIP